MTAFEGSSAEGARRAALALRALGPADRAWMLERLPQERQKEMETLLRELDVLGLPKDTGMLDQLLAMRCTEPMLKQPTSAQLANALEGEPPALVALARHAYDTSTTSEIPVRLREALMAEVRVRVTALDDRKVIGSPPFLRRWQAGVRRICRGLP